MNKKKFMKISLNWLKEFIKISENPQKIEAILTETGLEVDEVININPETKSLEKLVVGEITVSYTPLRAHETARTLVCRGVR